MTHWGWYWKVKRQHRAKSLCDYQTCIDSFALFKEGECAGFTVKKEGKVEILAKAKDNHFIVKSDEYSFNLAFEKQPCHFGGFRYFFRCPKCNNRMRKLYRYGCIFVCRKCLNLGYRSQSVASSQRFWLMGKKIVTALEEQGGSLYEKPKWMRWATFEKLKAKHHEYEWKSERATYKEFHSMFGVYP